MGETLTKSDSQFLVASLPDLPEPVLEPAFIIVSGLPGTGEHSSPGSWRRERFCSIAEHAGASLVLVNISAPPEVVRQRMKRKYLSVDTSRDITPAIDRIAKEVSR